MSLLSEKVIPGNHGKVFETNAKEDHELAKIQKAILQVHGVKDFVINEQKFPRSFTIHTHALVEIKDIEDAVQSTGFHAIPRHLFTL